MGSEVDSREKFYSSKIPYGEEGFIVQPSFPDIVHQIENFEVRNTDIFVMGFQKAGTTWAQELVWCIVNDLNFTESRNIYINKKFPLMEMCTYPIPHEADRCLWDSLNFINEQPSPRFIKTHLPWPLIPRQIRVHEKNPKIVYVHRDPRDVCVSLYFHLKNFYLFSGSLEELCNDMINDKELYCPFWKHVQSFLSKKHLPNIFIISYEEMKQDLREVIRNVGTFFGKSLNEKQVELLFEHLSFNSMKKNDSINEHGTAVDKNGFLRKGESGDYKNHMSPELLERFDAWIQKNKPF